MNIIKSLKPLRVKVLLETPIWFQVEGRYENKLTTLPGGEFIDLLEAIKSEIPGYITCKATALTLEVKKTTDNVYATLNKLVFKRDCENNFSKLIEKFEIGRKNPIIVTLPGNYPCLVLLITLIIIIFDFRFFLSHNHLQ